MLRPCGTNNQFTIISIEYHCDGYSMAVKFFCEKHKNLSRIKLILSVAFGKGYVFMLTENTHYGADAVRNILKDCRGVFFIGIGGINMSSLAHLTHASGYYVAGSDHTRSALCERLEREGIKISYEHKAENIEGCDVIVYTVAIPDDNPEYSAARAAGLPCISRANYMGYLMTGYRRRIGISGMHGKSTCTSMCASVFMDAGVDPTVLSGAELAKMGGAWRVGSRDSMIFEACEYRDSFLDFYPTIAVILNIEPDHLDYFSGIDHIKNSFEAFVKRPGCECVVANADDENVREVVERAGVPTVTFSLHSPGADYLATNIVAENGKYSFDVLRRGEFLCRVHLAIPGLHSISNALAALAVADLCGIPAEDICRGLGYFTGASRRMEYKGKLKGARVYDDYAHHPTEIRASLEALAAVRPDDSRGELICVFQSHTYNRTAALFDEFATAFEAADRVIVADIYAARVGEDCGVSAEKLAQAIGMRAEYVGDMAHIAEYLNNNIREDDTLIIMGAGDICKLFSMLELD